MLWKMKKSDNVNKVSEIKNMIVIKVNRKMKDWWILSENKTNKKNKKLGKIRNLEKQSRKHNSDSSETQKK